MTTYLIRRTATAIVVLFGVPIFIFFMLHVIYPMSAIDVLSPHANKFSIAQGNGNTGSTSRGSSSTSGTSGNR